MKTKRDKLKELVKEKKELESKIQKISEKMSLIEEYMNDLKDAVVEKEGLLGATSWELRVGDKGEITLHNHANESFKGLTDLCYDGWGIRVRVKGAYFYEHDNDMYISFKSNDDVLPFIKKYGIKLDTSKVKKHMEELEAGLKFLNTVKNFGMFE